MAGSYNAAYKGFSLIENLGDAQEAIHEMLWLIESQIGHEIAMKLLEDYYYPMCRGEMQKDDAFIVADEAQDD